MCGNYENFDQLYNYPIEEWNGGKIHKINDSVFHLMRGQVFKIDGKSFFTFGGASSHNIPDGILEMDDPRVLRWMFDREKMYRVNHVSWWKEELPSEEEMAEGIKKLEKNDNKIDYIITHSPCTSFLKQMDGNTGLYKPDVLSDYLEKIKNTVNYRHWYFGHMHVNEEFPSEKSTCLYENIMLLK